MNKKATNQAAVIYARFSTESQREESIEAQIRACREYAARNHIEIIGEYIDRAKSATSSQRPDFQRMIKDSKDGKFSVIIVHKLDRFSRDRYDSAVYKHQLNVNGVALRSVTECLDDSPESVMLESLLVGMAEYYSKNLAREVMKGLKENALQGRHTGGIPPLGYDVDPVTRKLVINPVEAEAVKLIFSMYLDGKTYGQIGDLLNERGFTTKLGKQFSKNSLHDLLRNPKYTGVFTYSRIAAKDASGKWNRRAYKPDDEVIKVDGAIPMLISKEDFARVQEMLRRRKHNSAKFHAKRTYLLTGKVVCGECGTAYVGNCRPDKKSGREYLTYRCNNRMKRPRCCGWEINAHILESMVLSELAGIVFNDGVIPHLSEGYRKYLAEQNKGAEAIQDALSRQIAAIQKDMDSLTAVIIQTTSTALVSKLNALDAQKQELVRQLQKAQEDSGEHSLSEEALALSFKQAREMLKARQLPSVKALIERYVNKVVISGEHVEIQFHLNVNSRVATYPAPPAKKIPQPILQENAEVRSFLPLYNALVANGRGRRTRTLKNGFGDRHVTITSYPYWWSVLDSNQ